MAAPVQPAPNMQFNVAPVQIGDQVMVLVQVADTAGVMVQFTFSQDVARIFSKAIKDGVEKAEVTLVKPPSMLAQA